MSGCAVIYQRDGSPPDPAVLNRMLQALRHRGPDGGDVLHLPRAAFGCRHFWTTPEAVGERQPLSDSKQNLHLVFDGRLDNRDELFDALGLNGPGR